LDRRKNRATTRPLQASSRHLRKTSLGQEIEWDELDSTEPALAACEKVPTTDEGTLAFIQIIEEIDDDHDLANTEFDDGTNGLRVALDSLKQFLQQVRS